MKVEIEKSLKEALEAINKSFELRDRCMDMLENERRYMSEADFHNVLSIYSETIEGITRLEYDIDAMKRSLHVLEVAYNANIEEIENI